MYRILLVDDDAQQLKKYKRLFEADFVCLTASSGEEAITVFDQEEINAVVCDVSMPGGMSGFELCQHIKSLSPTTIVVLLSSYNNTSSRLEGLGAHADEYLYKLTDSREIFLKIRNLLYTQNNIPAASQSSPQPLNSAAASNSFEEDVRAIIVSHYQIPVFRRDPAKIDLNIISDKLCKGSRTVQRCFASEVGCTFREFHTKVRIEIAESLLANTISKSTREISEDLSFASQSAFCRAFKALHGITPSKYRNNYLDGA